MTVIGTDLITLTLQPALQEPMHVKLHHYPVCQAELQHAHVSQWDCPAALVTGMQAPDPDIAWASSSWGGQGQETLSAHWLGHCPPEQPVPADHHSLQWYLTFVGHGKRSL